jgi:hypothetical protein
MTFSDLRGLDGNDVLGWMGLQRRQSRGAWIAAGLGFFGAGLVAGAGLALLVAPKPGRELREELRGRLRRVPGLRRDAEDVEASAPVITREESKAGPSSNKTY